MTAQASPLALRVDPRERSAAARAAGLALLLTLAFATPATLQLAQGLLAPTESRFGDAIASALGGVTLPLVAAAVVASVFGSGSRLRAHVDRLVAAGAEPRAVIARPLLVTMFAAIAATALGAALTVLLLRAALHLGGAALVSSDMLATAWGAALGCAAWTGLAALLVVRSGRAVLGWMVVAIDLVLRLVPGAGAWLSPSAHVQNVLGAPPPRGFVHVPVLPQLASVGVLLVLAVATAALAARRYDGPPAR